MERLAFAHPAYLWGLLAVALPILVHLFNQRRPRPLAFGAIEFVLRSQRQKARRLRLRQIVLLALRCLLIAAVAMALARPSIKPKGAQAALAVGPQATALVRRAAGAPPGWPGIKPNVVLVDAAQGSDLPNAAVITIAVRPSASLGARGYEVVATIANHSSQQASGLQVSLKIGQNTLAKG